MWPPRGPTLSGVIVSCRFHESNKVDYTAGIGYFCDCPIESIGGVLMNSLEEVMSVTEAAELWGLKPVSVRLACTGYSRSEPRFTKKEARKSGNTWLVTRAGMERLYGPLEP